MILYKKILILCRAIRVILITFMERFFSNSKREGADLSLLKKTIIHMCIVLMSSICFVICECLNKKSFLNFDHTCVKSAITRNLTLVIGFPKNRCFNSMIRRSVASLEITFNTCFAIMITL